MLNTTCQSLSAIEAITNEANVYEESDLYEDAVRTYRRAFDIDPENADVMANMAQCLIMLDRIKAAVDMAKRCLLYDPDNKLAKAILRGACD